MKKPGKLAIPFGLLITGFIVVLVFLHSDSGKGFVISRLKELLASRYDLALKLDSLDYDLFGMSASARGLSLSQGESPEFFSTQQLDINLSFLDLLRGNFTLESAHLAGVSVNIVLAEQTNLPSWVDSGRSERGPVGSNFLISTLEVKDGSFRLTDEARGLSIDAASWALEVSGDRESGEHSIDLQTHSKTELRIQNKALMFDPFDVRTTFSSEGLRLESLQIQWDRSDLRMTGVVPFSSDEALESKLDITVDSSQLAHFLGLSEPVDGLLNAEIHLGESLHHPTLEAHLTGEMLSWRSLSSIDMVADLEWRIKDARIAVKEAVISTPQGTLRGRSLLALTEEAGDSEASLQLSDFNMAILADLLDLRQRMISRASGAVDLSWPGLALDQFVGSGAIALTSSQRGVSIDRLPVSGALSLNATPERYHLSTEELWVAGLFLNGETTIQRSQERFSSGRLSGQVSGSTDDLGMVLPPLLDLFGHTDPEIGGSAECKVALSGTVENPQASFSLQAADVEGYEFEGIGLEIAGDLDGSQVQLFGGQLIWKGGKIRAAGTLDLSQPNPEMDFSGSLESLPLLDLGLQLESPIPGSGEAFADFSLTGTFREPNVAFEGGVSDLHVAAENLGSLELMGEFRNRTLRLSRFSIREPLSEGGDLLIASGHLDLSSETFDIQAKGKQLNLSALRITEDRELAGLLDLSIRASGEWDNPSANLEMSLAEPSISGYPMVPIQLEAILKNGKVEVDAQASSAALSVHMAGAVEAPYPVHLTVRAENTDLGKIPSLKHLLPELTGMLTGELEAKGELSNWRDTQLSLKLSKVETAWNELTLRNRTPVHLRYSDRSITVQKSELLLNSGFLEIEGNLPLDTRSQSAGLTANINLGIPELIKLLPSANQFESSGQVTLEAEVRGSLSQPELSGELRVFDASLAGDSIKVPISNLGAEFVFDKDSIRLVKLLALAGEGTIHADGLIPIDVLLGNGGDPIRVSASLEEFPLESVGLLPERLSGLATAQLELTGPELQFRSFAGAAAFGDLQLSAGELTLQETEPVLLTLQNGQVWIERAELTGPDSQVRASGGVDLEQPGSLEVKLEGSVSTTLLAELVGNFESSGKSQFQLSVAGLPGPPEITGSFSVDGGTLLIPSLEIQVDDLTLMVQASNNQFQIEQLDGDLNGGSFKGDGSVVISDGEIGPAELLFVLTDIVLELPEGLNTISDGVVSVSSTGQGFVLDGEIRVLEGSYRDRVDLGSSLVRHLRTGRRTNVVLEEDPVLSGLRFAVGVETIDPIVVDNNLAEVVLQGRVVLGGSYYRPGMTGSITVEPGGEIYLRERTYVVEYGAISFLEDSRIRPELDVRARTRAQEYDITLQAMGPLSDLKTSFSSDPALAEPDIVSVLLTGRTLEELRGAEARVAQEQALSFLAGAAGGQIGRQVEDAIGLSRVRIEPYLIANESKPETRLTIGQDITSDLRGIYSVNLADTGDQIWVAEYDLTRRFRTRGIKQADNTYRFDFNHRLRFPTARPAGRASQRRLVGEIQFEGNHSLSESMLLDKFDVRSGQSYDFSRTQKGLDRVRSLFNDEDLLEARVRIRRSESEGVVDLVMRIDGGPRVVLAFAGDELPSGTHKRVRELWGRGVSDTQRRRESLQEIQRHLVEHGHLTAQVDCEVSYTQDYKRVTFQVSNGPEFERTTVAFKGVEAFEPQWLEAQLVAESLVLPIFLGQSETASFLVGLYRNEGFLDARLEEPELVFDIEKSEARVTLTVVEGPLYRVGEISFEGNRVFDDQALWKAAEVKRDDVFRPDTVGRIVVRLEDFYWSQGYNESEITDSAQRADDYRVDLSFQIDENIQDFIQEIEISGQKRVSAEFIKRQMAVEIGTILDLEEVSRARKRLYDTGAFALVEIEPVEVAKAPGGSGTQRPMRLAVRVRETVPHRINYGAFFDTDRGPGLSVDYRNHNLLRNGRVLGLSSRVDGDRREVRGYFSQPARHRFPLRTVASTFFAREFRPGFEFDEAGFSIEQQAELKDTLIGSYGFSFVRNWIREEDLEAQLEDKPLNVGSLDTALAWDTRDSFLEPTGGHFFSNAFRFAPTQLGSDFPFIKYFGGYSRYFPLKQSASGRPRLIFATWARIGLAKGFDQDLIPLTERFFAGGGTTIRGFKQDTVGPVNDNGIPVGGNSLFIWNNELRFPIVSFLDGVGFLDVGNVYPTLSDFDPTDVRKAAGLGLRVRTPFVLIRFDYGFKLDRRQDESRGAFFFSIGQAF